MRASLTTYKTEINPIPTYTANGAIAKKSRVTSKIPQFKFKTKDGKTGTVYYTNVEDTYYFRACDIWSSCTLQSRGFFSSLFEITGDFKRILFDKSVGCPATRATYAVTAEQALEACAKLQGAPHPVEKWLKDNFSPTGLPVAEAEVIPLVKSPQNTPLATLSIGEKEQMHYSLHCKQRLSSVAWRLPALKNGDMVFWPDRLGVDIDDINAIIKLTPDAIESINNRLWAHRDSQDYVHRLVDQNCWERLKALPACESADPAAIEALDALFALGREKMDGKQDVNGGCDKATKPKFAKPPKAATERQQPTVTTRPLTDAAPAAIGAMEARAFDFSTANHHVAHVHAAMDAEGRLWLSRPCLNLVFGSLQSWPTAVKNAPRRQILLNGETYPALCESNIPLLTESMENAENKALGLEFEHWLAMDVSPAFSEPITQPAAPAEEFDDAELDGREIDFFFLGASHSIRVAVDGAGDLWAVVSDIEKLFGCPVKNWPERARKAPRRIIAHHGLRFPAVSEEWFGVIAASAPPSRRNRTKAFTKWWTDSVWPLFDDAPAQAVETAPSKAPPAPQPASSALTLADQTREAARLLMLLADDSDAKQAEIDRLKSENSGVREMKEMLAKKIANVQKMLGEISV